MKFKINKNVDLVNQAIIEYKTGDLSRVEICKKYNITPGIFKYRYYEKPKHNLKQRKYNVQPISEKNSVQEKIKSETSEMKKRKPKVQKQIESTENLPYVEQPTAQRKGSKNLGHDMYNHVIRTSSSEPKRAGSYTGSKYDGRIYNDDIQSNPIDLKKEISKQQKSRKVIRLKDEDIFDQNTGRIRVTNIFKS